MNHTSGDSARARGPRGGDADTRGDILGAATEVFGERGYAAASVREIARRADVDPALVRHYFPDKTDLFIASVRPVRADDPRLQALATTPRAELGEAVVHLFIAAWDAPEMRARARALLASVAATEELGQAFARVMLRDLLGGLVRQDAPELRAEACGSQLIGLAVARYVLSLPAITAAPPERLATLYGPTLQRYIDGDLDGLASVPPGNVPSHPR